MVSWGKCTFYQGNDLSCLNELVNRYIRSVTVYDQFTTCGMFNAVWLSDEVRTAYAQLHSCRLGKKEEYYKAFLRRQIAASSHFIEFYMLSSNDIRLDEEHAPWSVLLRVKNEEYAPTEIKLVELPHEYRLFFGTLLTPFKLAYQVKFNALDLNENQIIDKEVNSLTIYLRSAYKETALIWHLDDAGGVVRTPRRRGGRQCAKVMRLYDTIEAVDEHCSGC